MRRTCGVIAAAAIAAVSAFVVMAPAGAATPGTISRFAGSGTQGFSGNGGPATAADFFYPSDEAFSSSGTGYIADMKNCQVRQVVNGVISAFAGVGTCATRGNAGNNPLKGMGGQAAAATIGMPTGVAVDSSGDVYVADCVVFTGTGPGCTEGYILEISTSGIISIFAGDSKVGNGGSGGAATATSIGAPWGVRTDAAGDVYFSDVVYNVVREVNTSGIIKTVAGNGKAGYSGNGGAATSAEIDDPTGLYVDGSGNLFIADSKNAVIRKVNASGIISTFAGTGTAGFSGNGGLATAAELNQPFGMVEDTAGNVYIADYAAFCVREVFANGDIGTYSGTCGTEGVTQEGGTPSSALLEGPSQVVFDPSGDLYINDFAGEQIDEVAGAESASLLTPSTPTISNLPSSGTVGANFTATVTTTSNGTTSVTSSTPTICTASGLTVSFVGPGTCSLTAQVAASTTYAAATGTAQTVRVTAATRTISRFAGNGVQGSSGNGGAATAAEFHNASDEAFSPSGIGYIADMKNCQVRQVVNGVISAFAGTGTTCPNDGGVVANNPLSGIGGPAAAASIGMPTGVAVDSSGNVYIADCTVYTGTGPGCTQGYILKVAGGTITELVTPAQIGSPWTKDGNGGVAAPWGVRTAGGKVYFSDVVDSVVDEVSSSGGTPVTVAGNGTAGYSGNGGAATSAEIDDPTGLYVDGSGNLFIADSKNAVIRKVNASGIISTFAGTGTAGFSGNGGLATAAELDKPFGMVEDTAGNVYIADYGAFCVREVFANGDIGTYSGTCGTEGVTKEGGTPSSALLEGPSQVVFDPSGDLYINDYAGEQIDEVAGAE
jgi:hypothetical protein